MRSRSEIARLQAMLKARPSPLSLAQRRSIQREIESMKRQATERPRPIMLPETHKPGGKVTLPGQLDLPQTGEAFADLARRKAAEPLRPAVPQKPCDTGLFSDEARQIDLEDLI